MKRIFETILRWYLDTRKFDESVVKLNGKMVNSTLEAYKEVKKIFLPTPTKSHYLFNLRDFSKVIQGICLTDKDKIKTTDVAIRLWTHEVWRVFGDRLNSERDRL
jgi:dynein heavy chain, axonemal